LVFALATLGFLFDQAFAFSKRARSVPERKKFLAGCLFFPLFLSYIDLLAASISLFFPSVLRSPPCSLPSAFPKEGAVLSFLSGHAVCAVPFFKRTRFPPFGLFAYVKERPPSR